jgi:hypothetical protein
MQLVMPNSEACFAPRENQAGVILAVDGTPAAATDSEAERAKAWACKICSQGHSMAVLLPLTLHFPAGVDAVSPLQTCQFELLSCHSFCSNTFFGACTASDC